MESMAARVREHATYEDLLRVPDNMVAELIEGELYASPRPAGPHTLAASALSGLLVPPFQFGSNGPGGWWILHEPEVHLGPDVLVPDLAGWRTERMPQVPKNHVFDISPDWVCEVTSPSSGRIDRVKKMPIYARHEVQFSWIVEPEHLTLEAYRLQGLGWYLLGSYGAESVARIEPFESVEINLTLL
jgi:Uma2 family endonuclease